MNTTIFLFFLATFVIEIFCAKDMMRKSIVFDKNTPDVFYCPIHKPTGFDKLIVKARPLKKLCEFEGKTLPEDYKSDCYQDVDESDYACKEKYRIMMRKNPPGSDEPYTNPRMARFVNVDKEYYITKMGEKSKPKTRRGSTTFKSKRPNIFLRNRLG